MASTALTLVRKFGMSEHSLVQMQMRHWIREEVLRSRVSIGFSPDNSPRKWRAYGLTCYVRDGPYCLNGYVIVPEDHKWYKIHYDECPKQCRVDCCDHTPESIIQVHGGITYSCLSEEGWVFGFDTAHYGDAISLPGLEMEGRHWDVHDVADEVDKLAAQLACWTY